ncbi:hypothetical protein [Bradyrhizobium sp. BWC-3-1]|uniref:helix-turn-helix transcriptional regulator n=1 Tax=Bradyrhizobium sp. BWC-3-1 TaxID=3080012 RepID=UPI00293F558A|nr:hypothetical protein [Bradyrhizobium sp. BWC-3-1]WOH58521.1 hypothetical protein RX329_41655 [Bradyrhizobium sp. BWC-3-1]
MTESPFAPRLLSGIDAATYCGITLATWSKWVAAGLMPKPVIGRRWDKKAIDLALDKASGIQDLVTRSVHQHDGDAALEAWWRKDGAKHGAASGDDHLRRRYRWEEAFDAAWAEHLTEHGASYAQQPAGETEQQRQRLWNIWKDLKGTALAPMKKRDEPRS